MEQQELDLSVADGYVVTRTDEDSNCLCYVQPTPHTSAIPAIFFKMDAAQQYADYLHSLYPDYEYKVTSFSFVANGLPEYRQ